MTDHDETKDSSFNVDGTFYEGEFKGHYDRIASNYDKFLEFYHSCTVNAIKHYIPLTKSDQIIDIGGGTGEMVRLLRQEFGIETPGICVEPNLKMLQIAMNKDGIIPIQSTAEVFLAAEPKFPMKFVLMNGCAHHIKDLAGAFANLARHMPDDGICLLTQYHPPTNIAIQAEVNEKKCGEYSQLKQILKFNNLKHKVFYWKEPKQMEKLVWYETLRGRYSSSISNLTDKEIEEEISELEKKFGAEKILKFEVEIEMNIITKDCDRF